MRTEINKFIVADSEIYRKSKIFGRSRNDLHFGICHGKPTFKGTRVLVSGIVELVAAGEPIEDILEDYPSITREHISAALEYAAKLVSGERYAKFSKIPA